MLRIVRVRTRDLRFTWETGPYRSSLPSMGGGGGISFGHLVLSLGFRVNVCVWVNVRVRVRVLTTLIFPLESSSSQLWCSWRPFHTTVIQGVEV